MFAHTTIRDVLSTCVLVFILLSGFAAADTSTLPAKKGPAPVPVNPVDPVGREETLDPKSSTGDGGSLRYNYAKPKPPVSGEESDDSSDAGDDDTDSASSSDAEGSTSESSTSDASSPATTESSTDSSASSATEKSANDESSDAPTQSSAESGSETESAAPSAPAQTSNAVPTITGRVIATPSNAGGALAALFVTAVMAATSYAAYFGVNKP